MFDQKILWNFEDLKKLLGTELPIFGGDTYPCISLQLRSMSKPIRVLSGIDNWLDNLMSHVPKVTMCYQSNSFVQKHELVLNEDLPSLNDSSCSPKVITYVAQNLLSFLKLNITIPGHTYWLFKGKNDDIVKLYDLSSLYSESWFEDFNEGQNPFTIPVAMLLYNVAWNLKNNPIDDIPSNLPNIEILLNNCLKLLNTTKYPQVVTSVCYMLSDFYIPFDVDYELQKFEDFTNTAVNSRISCVDSDKNLSTSSDTEESTFFIGTRDLCLSHKKKKKSKKLENPTSEIIVMTLEERCRKALYHIGVGLNCFQYLKDPNDKCRKKNNVSQINDESNTAALSVTIPCLTTKKDRKMKRNKKVVNKGIKKKNQKHNEGSVVVENDSDFIPSLLLVKYVTYIMLKWRNLPQSQERFILKEHMITLFYEKACRIYVLLAENDRMCTKYGTALKYYRSFYKCFAYISNFILTDYNGFLLERSGDCCLLIAQNWNKVKQYQIELETDDECDLKIMKSLSGKFDSCKQQEVLNLIPTTFESKEATLNAAVNCYKGVLEVEINEDYKKKLNEKLGNVYHEIALRYIDEISDVATKKKKVNPTRLQWLLKTSENYLTIGIDKFESICDLKGVALIYFDKGQLYQNISLHSSQNKLFNSGLIKDKDFAKMAAESFTKSLAVMGNRRSNEHIWDLIFYNLSTTLYNIAAQYQDNPPKHLACVKLLDLDRIDIEKEIINLLLKALKHCDLENDVFRKLIYEARAGNIHNRLATLYHSRLRRMKVNTPKFKITLRQCSSHYNDAYGIFLKMNNPLQCLEILLKNIALDELQFEKTTSSKSKVKFIMSITQKLSENCVCILQMILESKLDEDKDHSIDNDNFCKPDQKIKNNQDTEMEKLLLLNSLKDRLQHILMCMIKLSITKLPKFVEKTEQLKIIYGDFLRTSEADDNCSLLLRVIMQIKELNL